MGPVPRPCHKPRLPTLCMQAQEQRSRPRILFGMGEEGGEPLYSTSSKLQERAVSPEPVTTILKYPSDSSGRQHTRSELAREHGVHGLGRFASKLAPTAIGDPSGFATMGYSVSPDTLVLIGLSLRLVGDDLDFHAHVHEQIVHHGRSGGWLVGEVFGVHGVVGLEIVFHVR